jgi:hypothetical protein
MRRHHLPNRRHHRRGGNACNRIRGQKHTDRIVGINCVCFAQACAIAPQGNAGVKMAGEICNTLALQIRGGEDESAETQAHQNEWEICFFMRLFEFPSIAAITDRVNPGKAAHCNNNVTNEPG